MCNAPDCPLLQAVLSWLSTGKRIGDVRREARKKEEALKEIEEIEKIIASNKPIDQ